MINEKEIKQAIETLKSKYGITGIDNKYMLATDIDGDLRIAPFGLMDLMLKEYNAVNTYNFIKIKDLQ